MATKAESQKMSVKIAEFFDVLGNKSPSTISGYKSAIWAFFQFALKLTDAEKQTYGAKVDAYFESHDATAIYQDFKAFLQSPASQSKAPKGALQTFNQIFNFFALSDVVLSGKQRTVLMNQLPQGGVISEETHLSTEMLKQMLAHSDVKGRAVLLTLATSGMRIGELLNIRCSDVHKPTKEVPAMWFNIKKSKNGTQRHTFCSTEAQIAVEEWIKIRPQFIEENRNRGTNLMSKKQKAAGFTKTSKADDDRLFPISQSSAAELIAGLVTKVTGENAKDETTGRSLIHAHGFRKFFVSKLAESVEMGIINFWAGHLTNLDKTYLKKTPADTVKLYLKGEINLYIEAPEALREQGIKNNEKINNIMENELQSSMRINRLENEKADLAAIVKKQTKDIEELHAMFAETLAILKDRQERDRA